MEKRLEIIENEKRNERIVLVLNSIFSIVMTVVAVINKMNTWIPQIIITTTVISWWAYIKNYREFRFRSYLTTVFMWVNFLVYGINTNNYMVLLPIMCVLTIAVGIYGVPRIIKVSIAFSVMIMSYHIFFKGNIFDIPFNEIVVSIAQAVGIILIESIIYALINSQYKNRQILLETIEALKKVEKSKDDFLANVSHELRTPINTVCGMSEMILREDISSEVRRDVFDIQTAGRNLLAIVSDVLDFSELDSGKMEFVEDTYNITSTINDIINMSIARKNNKNVELIVDCDANIPRGLVGDEQKIRRAIMNVVDNAIKFTNEGGIIITISFRKESYGINLCVNVKDTGIGMKEETLDKLFTSFNQVDTKRNRQEGGIGLGLAIAQTIVTRMGGFITVKSKYEKGSELQLVIPQKVVDERPIVTVKNARKLYVAVYTDMEKYDFVSVREGYYNCICHIVDQLGIASRQCKNLQELKRRVEKENFTHIVIRWEEYCEDQQYFEELSYRKKVILVHERENQNTTAGQMYYVYKPFYVLSVASVLNGDAIMQSMDGSHYQGRCFTAPMASVLVVDDNVMNLRVVEGLLRPYKIKVFVAGSGKEALKKIESMDFDFVFMDHMMPEMDGVETLHKIRQKQGQYFKTVPIIALTANAIGGAREMFLAEGFADFVAKPIEMSVLERVMRKFIPEHKIIKVNQAEDESKTETTAIQIEDVNAADSTNEILSQNAEETIVIDGVDIKTGLTYSGGNIGDYIDIVQIYYTSGITKTAEIQKAYRDKDWKNYAIFTHSLKSTSMSIGAVHLSELAKGLEMAGKESDEQYITQHHDEAMEEYERILNEIGKNRTIFPEGVGAGDNNKTVSAAEASELENNKAVQTMTNQRLHQELQLLKEQLETFEFEGVQNKLEELWMYEAEGLKLEELLKPVREKVDSFDFMGAIEILETVRENMG